MAKRPPRPAALLAPASAEGVIQTTLGAVVAAEQALARLMDPAVRLPIRVAYNVAKLARLITADLAHYSEQKAAWIAELGEKREPTAEERANGATEITQVTPANTVEFRRRIEELSALPVEIAWRKIDVDAFGLFAISAGDLFALEPFITGEPSPGSPEAPKA